jgi:hypothetical protein
MSAQPTSPAPTSAEVRAEIELTRQAMDRTLEDLGEVLSPSRLVSLVRGSVEGMASEALGAARRSPALLIGSGLVLGFVLGRLVARRR